MNLHTGQYINLLKLYIITVQKELQLYICHSKILYNQSGIADTYNDTQQPMVYN